MEKKLGRKRVVIRILPELEEISNPEYLGVTLNDKLSSRRPHNNTLCSKLSTGLFVIRRMMNNIVTRTGNTVNMLFLGLISDTE